MVNIKEAARAAVTAYGLASEKGGNTSVPLQEVAESLASFYLTNFTSFTLGQVTTLPQDPAPGVLKQLQLLNESGLGTDIRPCAARIEVVSSQSAMCWITFEIFPRTKKIDRWTWTNIYGFRLGEPRKNGLDGGWEFTNADQEFQKLLERVPDFYTGGKVP
ncbi:uncharacterized protein CTRU02_200747 [Colletotrichum truncatum]|uniref:Uncharacterized protein n=1 Tax=Colletotrichum truncatum TaxID=5467 RepID=A0ACC3ZFG6_COLTU|nr:uncharacterized protein CTRU02_00514 [Colletotrichum truncatum]KAF6801765.1 hypothetical protein CTRU02_00514 [Colletotrichum truncatum]